MFEQLRENKNKVDEANAILTDATQKLNSLQSEAKSLLGIKESNAQNFLRKIFAGNYPNDDTTLTDVFMNVFVVVGLVIGCFLVSPIFTLLLTPIPIYFIHKTIKTLK